MTATAFFDLAIALIAAELLGRLLLGRLNAGFIARHRGQVPAFLSGRLSAEESARAADYSLAKHALGERKLLVEGGALLGALFLGFFGWIDGLSRDLSGNPILQGLLFLALIGLADYLIDLPFSLYSTFVLEKRFGFNRTTPRVFATDQLKGFALSVAVGAPLFAVIQRIFEGLGGAWWIWAWAVLFLFSILLTWVFPEYIAPLFNKFTPLTDKELLEGIGDLSRKTGFNLTRVQVMDASRRSAHSNAYFTGFGRTKKIVLFDTLVAQVPKPGILSVLAHELGHFRLKHVQIGLALSQLATLAGLALLAYFIEKPWFYEAFGFERSVQAALFLLSILGGALGFWWTPLASWLSRRNEFSADRYAVQVMGEGENLKEALVGLSRGNLSAPQPHPVYSRFYYSHPPLAERLQAIDRCAKAATMGEPARGGHPGAP